MTWSEIASIATAVVGTIVGALAAYFAAAASSRAKEEEQRVERSRVDAAIQQLDRKELGNFLWNAAGDTSIADVIGRPVLDQRIMAALDVVSSFAGEPPETLGEPPDETKNVASSGEAYPELRRASTEIDEGEVWTGLARARRELELGLAGLTGQQPSANYRSTSSMLRELVWSNRISPSVAQAASFGFGTASAVIHGREVDQNTAREALRAINFALSELRSPERGDADDRL